MIGNNISKKIDADDKTLKEILHEQKYTIDYFQREYRWEQKHIRQLIEDLESAFLSNYQEGHDRASVEQYNTYYLGPVVICDKDGVLSIIDGQQRLTSVTLLLIFINNIFRKNGTDAKIDSLIRSEKFGKASYNLQIADREDCLNGLFEKAKYDSDEDDESINNLVGRYDDIVKLFPEEIADMSLLPLFLDWLKEKIIFVKIVAYSSENAYRIFETMNDRGLNLTPTEMLKGYLLSQVDPKEREQLDSLWKRHLNNFHEVGKDEDLEFFRGWFRGKYAETIRQGKIGAGNEDFEKIGTGFHTWVKDKTSQIGLTKKSDFANFIQKDFNFYANLFANTMVEAANNLTENMEHGYFSDYFNYAPSLVYPLLLAPILVDDNRSDIAKKYNLSCRFLETFLILRAINYKTVSQAATRYSIYTLVKKVRNKSVIELANIYKEELKKLDFSFDGIKDFGMHQQNKWYVRFLLARITNYIETNSGMQSSFEAYMTYGSKKPYQIEHIWADKYERFKDQFDQRDDFNKYRNKIGGLLLLSSGTNQSFGDETYEKKLPHYLKQNLLAQTLHPSCYEKNPNFLGFMKLESLPFKAYVKFGKAELDERSILYQRICEKIWSLDGFDRIARE